METHSPPKKQHSTPRLTREAWLQRALEAIGRRGQGWVGIHDLVKDLGVTKGSFYWHFKNREDFVEAMLDYWVEELTSSVAQAISAVDGTPQDRLLALAEFVTTNERATFDIAIHAWALRETKAAEAVAKAEAIRLNCVRSLFAEIGFEGRELEMRTRTFVVFHSFESGMLQQLSQAERLRQVALRHEWFVRKS